MGIKIWSTFQTFSTSCLPWSSCILLCPTGSGHYLRDNTCAPCSFIHTLLDRVSTVLILKQISTSLSANMSLMWSIYPLPTLFPSMNWLSALFDTHPHYMHHWKLIILHLIVSVLFLIGFLFLLKILYFVPLFPNALEHNKMDHFPWTCVTWKKRKFHSLINPLAPQGFLVLSKPQSRNYIQVTVKEIIPYFLSYFLNCSGRWKRRSIASLCFLVHHALEECMGNHCFILSGLSKVLSHPIEPPQLLLECFCCAINESDLDQSNQSQLINRSPDDFNTAPVKKICR